MIVANGVAAPWRGKLQNEVLAVLSKCQATSQTQVMECLMPVERAQGCIQSKYAESAENMRGQTGSSIDYKKAGTEELDAKCIWCPLEPCQEEMGSKDQGF